MKIQNTKDIQGTPLIDCLVYGSAKIGKTRFASTFPKPLFISFEQEEGLDSLRGLDVNYMQVKNLAEFLEAIKTVREELENPKSKIEIGTVVIDSLTSLYELVEDSFTVGYDKGGKRVKNRITWDMRTLINDKLLYLFNGIKSMKEKYGINVVFTAHTTEKQDDEITLRRIGVGSFGLSTALAKNVNYILYMNMSAGVRRLQIAPDEKYQTGVRALANIELPGSIDGDSSVNYETLIEVLGHEVPKAKKSKKK